jgi:hypothetical protein
MTRKVFDRQLRQLHQNVNRSIARECKRLADSGGIDICNEPDTEYFIAKVVLSAALTTCAEELLPPSRKAERLMTILKCS